MMGKETATKHQIFDVSMDRNPQAASDRFDDDGRLKRIGTVWIACVHIITAIIGSEVLSLPWAMAQIGWIAGLVVMVLFFFVTYKTSSLLAACYRSDDPLFGERNYTYMDVVHSNLGGWKARLCGLVQYSSLFGLASGYTIAASTSMVAIKRSNCFHENGDDNPCHVSSKIYMIMFGAFEIVFSQIPDFDQIWWLSIVAAIMSFTYSLIGLALAVAKIAVTRKFKGSLAGISKEAIAEPQKIWRCFQALGIIAFPYSYSVIQIEIQDTIKARPTEHERMKKATFKSLVVTTLFNILCGCLGYAAFGDLSLKNLLTDFSFYNPYWLLDIANAAIVVHLGGAYQVYCQPIFAFIEKEASKYFSDNILKKKIKIPIFGVRQYELNLFRLSWRSAFVIITIVLPMFVPYFHEFVSLSRVLGFWPLTVYFPVELYIVQKRIPRWSWRWFSLQMLSIGCLAVATVAAAGWVARIVFDLS